MRMYVSILALFFFTGIFSQNLYEPKEDLSSLRILVPEKNRGFGIEVSLVAMFTHGLNDRSGIRLGAGITLQKYIGDWKLATGIDTYKARQRFGIGTSFAGISYDDGKYGFSYYLNRYFQGDKQTSGLLNLRFNHFQILFEDDILALPFTRFVLHDRYRTAALELRYKGFIIGTNVYTNEADGLTDASLKNSKGIYKTGKQISSPVFIGYTNRNLIIRYGINNAIGGFVGQNWWHQFIFRTTDFKAGDYDNRFVQIGIDKPYTLY